jgi:hypothetical protein
MLKEKRNSRSILIIVSFQEATTPRRQPKKNIPPDYVYTTLWQ